MRPPQVSGILHAIRDRHCRDGAGCLGVRFSPKAILLYRRKARMTGLEPATSGVTGRNSKGGSAFRFTCSP